MEGRREVSVYLQTCDQQRFEVGKAGFSWKCLNIFATGCSTSRKSFPVPFNQEGEVPFLSFSTPVPTSGIFCFLLANTLANHQCLPRLAERKRKRMRHRLKIHVSSSNTRNPFLLSIAGGGGGSPYKSDGEVGLLAQVKGLRTLVSLRVARTQS